MHLIRRVAHVQPVSICPAGHIHAGPVISIELLYLVRDCTVHQLLPYPPVSALAVQPSAN